MQRKWLRVAGPFSFLATVLTASNCRETVSLFANYTSSNGVSIETVETPPDPPLKIIIFPLITKTGGGGGGGGGLTCIPVTSYSN